MRSIRGSRPPVAVVAVVTAIVVVAVSVALLSSISSLPKPSKIASDLGTRQNVLLIVVDDARYDDMFAMPKTREAIGDHGTTFTNAYVVNPICCPSRSSILTGNYSHTTGVYTDHLPNGGRPVFKRGGGERSNIATWLHAAGYRTALIGKYMNVNTDPKPPPGWDHFFAFYGVNGGYYNYPISDDGKVVHYGGAPSDYSTSVFLAQAESFIRSTPADQPLFLYFAPFAPHAVPVPAPGDQGSFDSAPWNPPPSFNEANVSDKPLYIRQEPLLGREAIKLFRERRLSTLLSVDRAVQALVDELRATGRLSNALIMFISDNGISLGEHRWRFKEAPYQEDVQVPLLIRDDALGSVPRTISDFALNIDLAPTIAQAAGIRPGSPVDGRSLIPLLHRPTMPWRSGFLIESAPSDKQRRQVPSYCGYHTMRYSYVRYSTGEQELYDLKTDPYEMTNRASDPAYAAIERQLEQLARSQCKPVPPLFDHGWSKASP